MGQTNSQFSTREVSTTGSGTALSETRPDAGSGTALPETRPDAGSGTALSETTTTTTTKEDMPKTECSRFCKAYGVLHLGMYGAFILLMLAMSYQAIKVGGKVKTSD